MRRPVRQTLGRQPAIFIEFIMCLRTLITPRHCGPLLGDRRSVEARKPQTKGPFFAEFCARSLSQALINSGLASTSPSGSKPHVGAASEARPNEAAYAYS
jgi:hypothetical protein